jgi:NTP pyrophosphatase (non-canonical NTP hydrolase)
MNDPGRARGSRRSFKDKISKFAPRGSGRLKNTVEGEDRKTIKPSETAIREDTTSIEFRRIYDEDSGKDKFDQMYNTQLESQLYLSRYVDHACYPGNDLVGKQQLFKDVLLLLIKECTEVLDEINFKHHMKRKIVDKEALKEELIDVLKYWMNLCLLYDIKSEEIIDIFMKKTKKVIEKFDNEMGINNVSQNTTDSE